MAFLTDAEKKDAGSAHLDHVEVEDVDQTRRSRLAAEHAEFEKNLTFWKSVKLYWRSCLWSLYTLILIFNFGIDNIISGLLTTMPKFRADYGEPIEVAPGFFDYTIPARWLSAFSAAAQGAAIIGGFIGGYLSDRFGRKITIAVSCVIAIGGIAAQYFSNGSLPVLVVGKGILGLPFGMWIVLATTYISETAPFQVRGVLSSMVNATIMAGVLLFSGVITVLGVRIDASAYKIPFAIQWALPSLILITIIFLPESPVWLCRMGRREKAISALRKLHGSCEDTRQEGILALIEETLKNEAESCGQQVEYRFGYRDCFNKSNRGRTIATMWVYASQYLSAAVLVIGWQSYFYIFTFGWSAEKAFNVYLGSTGVLFAANVIGWYLITRMKRRFILIWGQLIAAACLFVIGGCSTAGTNEGAIAAAAFMYIWSAVYVITMGSAGWVIGAELPALQLRAQTQALGNICFMFMSWVQAFIFPYMYNPDAGNLGGKIVFYYAATTTVGAIGCFFLVPETLNRTTGELDALYEAKTPIRKFDQAQVEGIKI